MRTFFSFGFMVSFGLAQAIRAHGQSDSLYDYRVSGFKVAYTSSGINNIEIGYGKGKLMPVREMIGPAGYYGGFLNVGYGFRSNNSYLTSKVSYEIMTVLPGARVSILNVTDFNKNQIVFLPEIGLSINAMISFMYGYNVYVTGNNFKLDRHSLSLSIIPYWKEKNQGKIKR